MNKGDHPLLDSRYLVKADPVSQDWPEGGVLPLLSHVATFRQHSTERKNHDPDASE